MSHKRLPRMPSDCFTEGPFNEKQNYHDHEEPLISKGTAKTLIAVLLYLGAIVLLRQAIIWQGWYKP